MIKTNYPLTFYERQQIEHHLRLRRKKREIARRLNRDHSVIVREINRNSDKKYGYRAEIAQAKADLKAKKTNTRKLNKDFFLRKHVEKELAKGYSPEQVAGRLKKFPPQELQGETMTEQNKAPILNRNDLEGVYGKRDIFLIEEISKAQRDADDKYYTSRQPTEEQVMAIFGEIEDYLSPMNNPSGTPEYYMISKSDWQSLKESKGVTDE